MRQAGLLTLLICLLGTLGFWRPHAAEAASDPGNAEPTLDVRNPPEVSRFEGGVPWAEVSGFAWAGETPLRDVMLVIDLSASMRLASGFDVDGDGRIGRVKIEGRHWALFPIFEDRSFNMDASYLSSDTEDSVINAALVAARRFVERVDLERVRVGIVTFDRHARLRTPLTDDRQTLLASVEGLRRRMTRRTTDVGPRDTATGLALATAGDLLIEGADPAAPRQRELLVLSDGLPSLPAKRAPEFLVAVSMVLTERGVDTHFFPLGPSAVWNGPFFDYLDEHAGTSHTRVADLRQIDDQLSTVRLDRVAAVEIENETTGTPAQAVRLFADGSFDGFVRLQDGPNTVRFRALTRDGSATEVIREIDYAPSVPENAADAKSQAREIEAFLARLQNRRVESELLLEVERAREAAARRSLEIRASEGGSEDAPDPATSEQPGAPSP